MLQALKAELAKTGAVLLAVVFLVSSPAAQPNSQNRQSSVKQLDSDLKSLLADYYTGKPVRARVSIPLSDSGLELVDGQIKNHLPANSSVSAGELMAIKEMRFRDRSIEFIFSYEPPEPDIPAPAGPVGSFGADARKTPPPVRKAELHRTDPRITLRYNHSISTEDLNLPSINRILSAVVEVSALNPQSAFSRLEAAQQKAATAQNDPKNAQVPGAPVIGSLTGARENIAEVQIESPVPGARVYIDGGYSGPLPRTIQLIAGPHTFLIIAPGYRQWEQRYLLAPSRISSIKPDLTPEK